MTPEERAELLDALLDGTITEADLLRIEAELTVDPKVRQQYYRRIQLESLLKSEFSDSDDRSSAAGEIKLASQMSTASEDLNYLSSARTFPVLAGMLIGIAACVPFLFVVRGSLNAGKPTEVAKNDVSAPESDETARDETARGFGVLIGASNATWANEEVRAGELLPPGALHLTQGQIHIELFSGVQLMIEGDAKFSVDSPMLVTMESGRARAHVPEPAQGFRLKTKDGEVVDLGTEFSIAIDESGANVKVLDGEVELQSERSQTQRIREGDALRLSKAGIVDVDKEWDDGLPSPLEFQDSMAEKLAAKIVSWEQASRDLLADGKLIAHYQFAPEQIRARLLENLVTPNRLRASDGAIVAGRRSADRWGRSGSALDFSRTGSRVRVFIPGEHRGLSMFCWVKVNSLDRMYNSLFLTDGHEDYEPHWQILEDGRVFFSVKLPKERGENFHHRFLSPKIWDSSLSGKWIMLGVTYDVDQQCVTHFLNGQPISVEAIPENAVCEKLKIGAASICNWSEPMYRKDATFVIRNLNGSMDEFAVCSGALSDAEILELYKAGNPNEN